ncbi:hypothetical protein KSP40_PGU020908 [Platanthera guangdongensis]|uniref:Uncharacterized protein n=1 Tax=Platanthera guangdongensis TaxID=2320717 RepID=A0ABR2N3A9_9ASPA
MPVSPSPRLRQALRNFPRFRTVFLVPLSLIIYILVFRRSSSAPFTTSTSSSITSTTSPSHLLFGISSSARTWPRRRNYLRAWWRPGITRGLVFLDSLLPTSPDDDRSLPSLRLSANTSRFPYSFNGGQRSAIRGARVAKEIFDAFDGKFEYGDVRWIVIGDDDTVFFLENLAGTLAKYDWEELYYVGSLSESAEQNGIHSFDMAFGGGGFAISYPLAKILSRVMDSCLMRYGHLFGSDARVFACLAELGVGLTREPGFHQYTNLHLVPLAGTEYFDFQKPPFTPTRRATLCPAAPQAPLASFPHHRLQSQQPPATLFNPYWASHLPPSSSMQTSCRPLLSLPTMQPPAASLLPAKPSAAALHLPSTAAPYQTLFSPWLPTLLFRLIIQRAARQILFLHLQVDLRGDLFGFLSTHPLQPLVSLHHIDFVNPLFPGKNHSESLIHISKATNIDPERILQQTVCYDRNNFRTVSVSWGFSVQVFEGNKLLTDLLASQKTFRPWKRGRNSTSGIYMFNTREFPRDPCKRPAIFFLERLFPSMNSIVSIYGRDVSGNCPGIPISTRRLQQITVNSEKYYLKIGKVRRRHCCDVVDSFDDNTVMNINIRKCEDGELIAMQRQ